MNVPQVKPLVNGFPFNCYEDEGFLLVEAASFVSLLVPRTTVMRVGFPIKNFFLRCDDIEFTGRITSHGLLGFYCSKSIVFHKTEKNYSAAEATGGRLYFRIRNTLYLVKRMSRVRFIYSLFLELWKTFVVPECRGIRVRACFDVLFFNPKIEYPIDREDKLHGGSVRDNDNVHSMSC